ncbi:MAG: flagellar hook-length control protein FliK [Bacillota bacterium]
MEIAQVTIAPESGGHLPPGLPPGEARAGEFLQLLLALLGAVKPPAAPAGAGSGHEDAGEDHPPAGEETAVTPGNRGGVPDGAPVLAGLPGAVTPAAGVAGATVQLADGNALQCRKAATAAARTAGVTVPAAPAEGVQAPVAAARADVAPWGRDAASAVDAPAHLQVPGGVRSFAGETAPAKPCPGASGGPPELLTEHPPCGPASPGLFEVWPHAQRPGAKESAVGDGVPAEISCAETAGVTGAHAGAPAPRPQGGVNGLPPATGRQGSGEPPGKAPAAEPRAAAASGALRTGGGEPAVAQTTAGHAVAANGAPGAGTEDGSAPAPAGAAPAAAARGAGMTPQQPQASWNRPDLPDGSRAFPASGGGQVAEVPSTGDATAALCRTVPLPPSGSGPAPQEATAAGGPAPEIRGDAARQVAGTAGPGADVRATAPGKADAVPAAGARETAPPGGIQAPSVPPPQGNAPPVSAQVAVAVVRHIEQLQQHPGRPLRLEIALEPPELGRVTVALTLARGELAAHFYTSEAAARDLLAAALPQLREALAQHNIWLGQAGVFLGQGGQTGNGFATPAGYAVPLPAGGEAEAPVPTEVAHPEPEHRLVNCFA